MQGIQFWPVCKGEGVWITHSGLSVGVNVGGGTVMVSAGVMGARLLLFPLKV